MAGETFDIDSNNSGTLSSEKHSGTLCTVLLIQLGDVYLGREEN